MLLFDNYQFALFLFTGVTSLLRYATSNHFWLLANITAVVRLVPSIQDVTLTNG
jgi:hypothetical protein